MKGRKKKILTINDIIYSDKRDYYGAKYKKSISDSRQSENTEKKIDQLRLGDVGKYSLKTKISNSPWVKSGRPASKSLSWLFKDVFTNSIIYKYNKSLLYQGGLFAFEYKNPKYKGTKNLLYFDKYPLVLSLGPIITKIGVRNLGFNLHYLPPKIRVVAICRIFELYKKIYRYNLFFNKEEPVSIRYQVIIKAMNQFGIRFSVKMYIPNRINKVVCFPMKDWFKAIFIPSQGYDSIRAAKLIQEWQKFCKREGYSSRANIDWKTFV